MEKRGVAACRQVCQVALLVFLCSGYALADEVILTNGDRLSGKIIDIRDGIMTLETGYSEPVKLKFEAVEKMSSTEPVELHLSDGEVLKGKITTSTDRQVAVEAGPGREAVAVAFDNIAALNPPPKKPATWKGNISVGGSWQDGNTDSMSASAGAMAVRRTENDRFLINFLYNKAETDGQRTAENTYGQLKYDYFLSPKWYLYLNVDMLSDDFQDLNFRTSVGPGVGYQIWDEENKSLGLEAGVAYTSEDRDLGEDSNWVSARIGINYLYKLFDRVIFTDQFVIYPNLDDTGEYTLRNEAALATGIGADWSLKLSNIWLNNSNPEPGFKKDDFTWILGLQYSF
jgi:putative salt-induced outer membrane protein YdiY